MQKSEFSESKKTGKLWKVELLGRTNVVFFELGLISYEVPTPYEKPKVVKEQVIFDDIIEKVPKGQVLYLTETGSVLIYTPGGIKTIGHVTNNWKIERQKLFDEHKACVNSTEKVEHFYSFPTYAVTAENKRATPESIHKIYKPKIALEYCSKFNLEDKCSKNLKHLSKVIIKDDNLCVLFISADGMDARHYSIIGSIPVYLYSKLEEWQRESFVKSMVGC
jgi:hypothetical protein